MYRVYFYSDAQIYRRERESSSWRIRGNDSYDRGVFLQDSGRCYCFIAGLSTLPEIPDKDRRRWTDRLYYSIS